MQIEIVLINYTYIYESMIIEYYVQRVYWYPWLFDCFT